MTDHNFDWCLKTAFNNDYVNNEYNEENGLNDYYFKSMVDMYEHSEYFSEEYLIMEKEILESAWKFYADCVKNTVIQDGITYADKLIERLKNEKRD